MECALVQNNGQLAYPTVAVEQAKAQVLATAVNIEATDSFLHQCEKDRASQKTTERQVREIKGNYSTTLKVAAATTIVAGSVLWFKGIEWWQKAQQVKKG